MTNRIRMAVLATNAEASADLCLIFVWYSDFLVNLCLCAAPVDA